MGLHGASSPAWQTSRPHAPAEAAERLPCPEHTPGRPWKAAGGPGPALPGLGQASLTRLWLLAEMIFAALGFQMTRSASEPTATRPFLG